MGCTQTTNVALYSQADNNVAYYSCRVHLHHQREVFCALQLTNVQQRAHYDKGPWHGATCWRTQQSR